MREVREWRDLVMPVGRGLPGGVRRLVHRPAVFVRSYVGSQREFWRGFAVAVKAMRGHRPRVFGGSMLVIETARSRVGRMWGAEPNLEVVQVVGDHDELILPPCVTDVAAAIDNYFARR